MTLLKIQGDGPAHYSDDGGGSLTRAAMNRAADVSCSSRAASPDAIARRTTDGRQVGPQLRHRDNVLCAVTLAGQGFLRAPDWQQGVEYLLARLGEVTGARRVAVFEYRNGVHESADITWRHEWCAAGVEPCHGKWWLGRLRNGRMKGHHVREYVMSEAPAHANGTAQSVLVVPIPTDCSWWGFFAIEGCAADAQWGGLGPEALYVAACTFGEAVQRKEAD